MQSTSCSIWFLAGPRNCNAFLSHCIFHFSLPLGHRYVGSPNRRNTVPSACCTGKWGLSGKEKTRPKSLGKIKEQGLLRDMADSRSGAINTQDEPGTSGPFQKVRTLSKKIDVVSSVRSQLEKSPICWRWEINKDNKYNCSYEIRKFIIILKTNYINLISHLWKMLGNQLIILKTGK